MLDRPRPRRFRTLFLSDFHLGLKGCQAERLNDFLRHNDAETIYLVGDVVDGWALRRHWHWPASHNLVVQQLLKKARNGARIVYIPGNHDEFLREYPGVHFGGVEISLSAIHTTAAGKRLLITHGDQCDTVVRYSPILSLLGSIAYIAVFFAGRLVTRIRQHAGFPYWSLSVWVKAKVKDASKFLKAYEVALAREAREAGVDGVVCGHIHIAGMHDVEGIRYINTGDWVDSCTAVVEDFDGELELIEWGAVADLAPAYELADVEGRRAA